MMNFNLYNKCCAVVCSSRNNGQIASARRYLLLAIRYCRNYNDKVTESEIYDIHYEWKPGKILQGFNSNE